jgi:hypothetical protein
MIVNSEQFKELIYKNYQFLVDVYGFSINRKDEWFYLFERPEVIIRVFKEHTTLVVDIEPIGKGASQLLKQNILPPRISVIVIAERLDPKLNYDIAIINQNNLVHNIPVEIERRSVLLKKYCTKMLQGDVSEWPMILKNHSDQASP